MADYAIANQIRPFQLPDIAGIANAMSSQSLNAMREDQLLQQSQQLRGAEAERGALRELFSRPGFDPMAPGSAREILLAAPTTGAATFNALMRARADQRAGDASARAGAASDRAAAVAGVEMAVKNTALFRDMFANATPENYGAIRAAAVHAVPQWDAALPTGYTPDGVQRILMTADRALARHFVNQTGDDGMQRVLSMPRYGEGPAAVVPGSESAARPQRMMGPSGPMEISGGPGGSSYTMIPPAGAPAAPGAPLAVPEPMAPAPAPMVPGPRTGAAPATPINAMLAPQDATVVGQPLAVPDFARLATPRTMAEADLNKRLLDVQQSQATARAAAEVQRENAPARADEAGKTAEATRRGTLTADQERDERKKQEGRTQVDTTLEKMASAYRRLESLGGVPGETRGVGANMAAYAAGTAPGQAVSQALGTRSQSVRNELQSLARTLITDIKNSTGMSAQEMNSNVELQQMLAAVSSPTQSIESVQAIIRNLSQRFGLNRDFTPSAPTAPAAAPPAPAARPTEPLPGPRRGAAQAPAGRPTLDQFLERARPANPNASVEDLTAYYNRTYGGR